MTIPECFFEERETAAEEEPGHQAPAGAPERFGGDDFQGLIGVHPRGPGQEEIADGREAADLDRLAAGPNFAERQDAEGRPAHQHEELRESAPECQAGQHGEAGGDRQCGLSPIGDRQDHRGERHRDQFGLPGLDRQEPDQGHRHRDQPAEARQLGRVGGEDRLMATDRVANQERRPPRPGTGPPAPRRSRSSQLRLMLAAFVFELQQRELVLR